MSDPSATPGSDTSEIRGGIPSAQAARPPYFLICATLIIIVTLCVGLIAYLRVFDGVTNSISGIAKDFHTETITETFYSDRLEVISTGGTTLEVAIAERTEKLTRKSSVTLWDQLIPLGTTESEITVPATYRYHIDLNDDWSISTRGGTCIVIAPALKPSLPVAIDTGEMQKKTRSGWARFDKNDNLEALERTITKRLEERALSPENLEDVREDCRDAVAGFIEKWLLQRDHWAEDRFNEIIVIFPDEMAPQEGPALRPTPSRKLAPAGDPSTGA